MSRRFRNFGSPNGGASHKFNGGNGRRFTSGRALQRKKASSIDESLFVKKASDISTQEYTPHNSFDDFDLVTALKVNIINHGYTQPTPIQDKSIQPILDGRDLIGLANTGTGKTAAFLIPMINKQYQDRMSRSLIIAPTRELALQILEEIKQFTQNMKLSTCLVIGGANIRRQVSELRRNPHFVVATPGRLRDLVEHKEIYLEDFETFVLDEVDLMVDIGFIHDVRFFVSLLPKNRQSLFFSATISPKIQQILKDFVTDPVTVSVKQQDTVESVNQDVVKVTPGSRKIEVLHDLLIQDGFEKVLIFGRTKHGVENLHRDLSQRGFKTGSIHGNKSQNHRIRTLESFKRNEIQILLATDVAARGLDIDNVTHVINYDQPESYEDYIHRIGRTGRAGKSGTALTFVD